MENVRLFAGRGVIQLAEEVCEKHLPEISVAPHSLECFLNGCFRIRLETLVAGCEIFILQSLFPNPQEKLMEVWQLAWTAKAKGAKEITAFFSYDSYTRSDREDKPNTCIVSSLLAQLHQAAGIDRVAIITPHFPQIAGFYGKMPVYLIKTIDIIVEHLQGLELDPKTTCVVAPDDNRIQDARYVAASLNSLPVVVLLKDRLSHTETKIIGIVGEPRESCVIVDEEILSGGTIKSGVGYLEKLGARRFILACTHGLLCGKAASSFSKDPRITHIIATNTNDAIYQLDLPKLTIISVAKRIAKVIEGLHFHKNLDDFLVRA